MQLCGCLLVGWLDGLDVIIMYVMLCVMYAWRMTHADVSQAHCCLWLMMYDVLLLMQADLSSPPRVITRLATIT